MADETELDKAEDEQEELFYDELALYVMNSFHRAKQHKDNIGVTRTIQDCLQRYRRKYDCEDMMKFAGISNYVGIAALIVKATYSWLKDAYFNAQDKPWTLEPTPTPELPEDLQRELEEAINAQLLESLSFGNAGIESENRKVIDELRNTASQMAMAFAMEKSKAMSTLIEDQFVEASFRDVLSEFLLDLSIFPNGILKGPVVRMAPVAVWDKNNYKFKEEARYYYERVDPINLFPSPDAKDVQNCEFIIEVMNMSRSRLNEAKGMKNYKSDAINLVLENQHLNYNRDSRLQVDDHTQERLDGVSRSDHYTRGSVFDVYEFHGRIPGHYILEFLELEAELEDAIDNFKKVDTGTEWGVIDPYEDYEVLAWVSNNTTIMLRTNAAKPIPRRPYYTTSCYKVPGAFWGESPLMAIADIEDFINSCIRSLIFNIGMSAGPLAEADVSKFPEGKTPQQIEPWTIYPVNGNSMNGKSGKAIEFTNVPTNAHQMVAVYKEMKALAHEVSGIPPYLYGESQGAAPTLGAFSLQYASATRGIKTIIGNVDHDVIEKLVTQQYYFNMYYHDDDGIKADARVNVRGSAGLIAQEQRQSRPLELLQALGPILAQMQPEVALGLAMETLRESGYDPQSLNGPANNAQREAANSLVGGNTQPPPVDGRSGNVNNIIQDNSLPAL